jgi:calcineurin-like phosphoesterase family protein
MMNIFLISDTHWGHKGVTEFLNHDGSKLRPWDNIEEMDEAMVANWNRVVGPKDKVYHLGDVVINRRAFPTLARLNGEKVLIKGNHDLFRLEEYTPYFKDIRGVGVVDGMVMTHIPLHPGSLERWGCNIHGHLHSNTVMRWTLDERQVVDEKYFSVCVEQPYMNYTPQPYELIKELIEERQK